MHTENQVSRYSGKVEIRLTQVLLELGCRAVEGLCPTARCVTSTCVWQVSEKLLFFGDGPKLCVCVAHS